MVTKTQLETCKRYMRVDGADDDEIITALMEAAVAYLTDAGIDAAHAPQSLYDLAVWALTLHYYDHRADVSTDKDFPPALRPVINQLKMSCQARASSAGATP